MLNKLLALVREYDMIQPGDTVVAAVSGGADSVALLWALYLLKDRLGITLEAAHFNHHLRGEESQRDENFVRSLCDRFDIPLHVGGQYVKTGEKGLEEAARRARYAYFDTLPGKLATAHTADDNAETVLMRMIRGTGLKGLGAIAPVRQRIIRPMLTVTRQEVLSFLEEYHLRYVEDSSNGEDDFLRNRIRHRLIPLLKAENPRLAENLSQMAMGLRQDNAALEALTQTESCPSATALREMGESLRRRTLCNFLERSGVKEPESAHILLAEKLVFSQKPSARASFPGGVVIARDYDRLVRLDKEKTLTPVPLPMNGTVELTELGLRLEVAPSNETVNTPDCFTVCPQGNLLLRQRMPGDEIRLSGGRKSLKKLFIDRKIPANRRPLIPVVVDEVGVCGVYGIGASQDRVGSGVMIRFIKM